MIFSFFRVNLCKSVSIRPFGYAQGMLIGNKHDLKKQSQLSRIAYRVLRTAEKEFEKQSQFSKAHMDVTPVTASRYVTLMPFRSEKTKPILYFPSEDGRVIGQTVGLRAAYHQRVTKRPIICDR
ncbi:MAG: hypothetical protein ACYSUD_09380, partial [Planctomycetota bacterium]